MFSYDQRQILKESIRENVKCCRIPVLACALIYIFLFLADSAYPGGLLVFGTGMGVILCSVFSTASFAISYGKSEKGSLYRELFPVIYGMTAYYLCSGKGIAENCLFILFPILCKLSGDAVKKRGPGSFIFIVLCALSALLDPINFIPMLFIIFVFLLSDLILEGNSLFMPLFRYISFVIVILGLSAYSLIPAFVNAGLSDKEGGNGGVFLLNYTPAVICTFLIFCVFIYYFSDAGIKEKLINAGVLTLLSLPSVMSVFGRWFSFGLYDTGMTFAFDTALLFCILRIALRGERFIKEDGDHSVRSLLAEVMTLICVVLIFILMKAPERKETLFAGFICTGIVILWFFVINRESRYKKAVVYIILCLDMIFNAFAYSKAGYYADVANFKRQIGSAFAIAGITGKDVEESGSAPTGYGDIYSEMASDVDYELFLEKHSDPVMEEVISFIEKESGLKVFTYENEFERINEKCMSLGVKGPLFKKIKDYNVDFEEHPYYVIRNLKDNVYNIEFTGRKIQKDLNDIYVPFSFTWDKTSDNDVFLIDSYSGKMLRYRAGEAEDNKISYLKFMQQDNFDVNFMVSAYETDPEVYDEIGNMMVRRMKEGDRDCVNPAKVLGAFISLWSVVFLVFLYIRKEGDGLRKKIYEKAEKISKGSAVLRIASFWENNRIYIWSFCFPVIVFLLMLTVNSCMPFGPDSIFDQDGSQLYIPQIIEGINAADTKSFLFSLSGGYGYGLLYTNGYALFQSLLRGFNVSGIIGLISLWEAFSIGLSSLAMAFYMTHRRFYEKADKKELSILIPAFAYSLCSYMISIHMYPTWYLNCIIFPLLILGFEMMVTERRYALYGAMLLISAINNLQLLLYVCIFLVVYFFTYSFKDIKDLLIKLIRFGVSSALSLMPSLYSVFAIIYSTDDSAYRDADSLFPTPGFHKSFWDQWQNYFFLSPTKTVDPDNGGLNAYVGVAVLFLTAVFLVSNKRKISEKVRLMVPVVFLTFCFNGVVLSYIMNGLHYQNNVPNRYAFLMAFMLGIIAYEGMKEIKGYDTVRYVLSGAGITLFVVLCFTLGKEKNPVSEISTLVLLISYVYVFVHMSKKKDLKGISVITVVLLGIELLLGTLNSAKGIEMGELAFYGDIDREREAVSLVSKKTEAFRVTYPYSHISCAGSLYNIPSLGLFNSNVTKHQADTAALFGNLSGTNWMIDRSDSTPFALSLQGVGVIAVSEYTQGSPLDLEEYEYITSSDRFMFYGNRNALGPAFYVPLKNEWADMDKRDIVSIYNELAKSVTGNKNELFEVVNVRHNSNENGFIYESVKGEPLGVDEVAGIYKNRYEEDKMGNIPLLKLHFSFMPTRSGQAYICGADMTSIGPVKEGEVCDIVTAYPNVVNVPGDNINIAIMDEDVYNDFINAERENEIVYKGFSHNSLLFESNLEKEGYIVFSIAYSPDHRAYIDGVETKVDDPAGSAIFLKIPAGRHSVELRFEPHGFYRMLIISLSVLVLDLLILLVMAKRKQNENKDD